MKKILFLTFVTLFLTGCIQEKLTKQESKWNAKVFFPYTNSIKDGQYKLIIINQGYPVGNDSRYDWRLDPTNGTLSDGNSYKEIPIGGTTVEVTVKSTDFVDNPVISRLVLSGTFNSWAKTETGEVLFTRIY